MKKNIVLFALGSLSLSCFVEGVDIRRSQELTSQVNSNDKNGETRAKYDMIERDQIDPTDALAIPFDDSEIENEEEINLGEKKEVFNLPQSPQKR